MCSALTSNSLTASGRAGIAESVLHADRARDDRDAIQLRAFGQDAADPPGECTDLVLFGSNDNAGFLRGPNDRRLVDGLHAVHVHDPGFVTELLLQDPCCPHGLRHHRPAGDDAQVLAFVDIVRGQHGIEAVDHLRGFTAQAYDVCHPEYKGRLLGSDDGRGFTRKANVFRSDMLQQQIVSGLPRFDCVAWNHD